ncbi:MAG: hypothetical protein V3R32_04110 [Nitrosomonadaceae bacterium]
MIVNTKVENLYEDIKMTIDKLVEKLKKVSIYKLSKITVAHYNVLWRIREGKTRNPTLDTVADIEKGLDSDIDLSIVRPKHD